MDIIDFAFKSAKENPLIPKWVKIIEDYCIKKNITHKDLIKAYEKLYKKTDVRPLK